MWSRTFICLVLMNYNLFAQGLFEGALEEDNESLGSRLNYEMDGYVRGGVYVGIVPEETAYESKSLYGETALKLRVRKSDVGNAFAEIRFTRDMVGDVSNITAQLREGYVSTFVGNFDVRIGQQIVVWGRADGYNPINSITPMNLLVFSPDEDDRRESNFLIRSFWNVNNMRLQAIWVPVYQPSVLPFSRVTLPEGMQLEENHYPDNRMTHSAGALKLDYMGSAIDGSISYFNGYFPMPGIGATITDNSSFTIYPSAYRTHILGADFSTTVGKYGVRGEFAYKKSEKKEKNWQSIPQSQVEYILGLDREFGDFSLIVQYIGKHVFDYSDMTNDSNNNLGRFQTRIALWNRMLSSQLEEWNHSLSFRPACKWLHDTLDAEILGMVNFSTEEIFLKPKVSYDMADDFTFTIGAQWYHGTDETLYGQIDESISSLFAELKASF